MSKSKKILIWILVAGIFVGAILKLFVIDFFHIQGQSMSPTLEDKSMVFVNKMQYGITAPFSQNFLIRWAEPQIDDLVIYLHDNKLVVKRCVGKGGDELEFLENSQYYLIVNNYRIPVSRQQYEKMSQFPKVPEGYILAVGDNYDQSVDSREYGFISVKNITGKVIGK